MNRVLAVHRHDRRSLVVPPQKLTLAVFEQIETAVAQTLRCTSPVVERVRVVLGLDGGELAAVESSS